MPMQPIHISRYQDPEAVQYQGTIEPEDRSWILFVDLEGAPHLFVRCSYETDEGKVEHGYVPASNDDMNELCKGYVAKPLTAQ